MGMLSGGVRIVVILTLYIFLDPYDYSSINETLSFATGSSNGSIVCLNITIADDQIYERTEYFAVLVIVETRSLLDTEVLGTILVHILNDDCKQK